MIIVEEWIKESREERSKHLDLSEPCLERGGNSTVHRGILSQYLNTNIPTGVDLCHYCGNGKCSNPKHLYWGTRKENIEDAQRHGTWESPWDKLVNKLGIDGAKSHLKSVSDPAKAGAGGAGKPKSVEHREKISKTIKQKYDNGDILGRK